MKEKLDAIMCNWETQRQFKILLCLKKLTLK